MLDIYEILRVLGYQPSRGQQAKQQGIYTLFKISDHIRIAKTR